MLGYLHPTAGAARVLGLDIVRDSVAIRRRIGYLPGGIALYDSLTGEELLNYLADLSGRPAVRRADLCERLELSASTLKRLVRDYSRGMRQKIGIVQALQHDPELAILDEPTEELDPLMQRAFYQILDTLKTEGRRSSSLRTSSPKSSGYAIGSRSSGAAGWSRWRTSRDCSRHKRNVSMRLHGAPPPRRRGWRVERSSCATVA